MKVRDDIEVEEVPQPEPNQEPGWRDIPKRKSRKKADEQLSLL